MSQDNFRICLVGAGQRVELAQHLIEAASELGVRIEFFSIEDSARVPISSVARIVEFPGRFDGPEFANFLKLAGEEYNFTCTIPLMDSAVPAILSAGLNSPVNTSSSMVRNKHELKNLALRLGIPTPVDVTSGPSHLRPKVGNGSIGVARMDAEQAVRDGFVDSHLIEEVLEGPEFSIDAYAFKDGSVKAALRKRLRVIGGEVQHTSTHRPTDEQLGYVERLVAATGLRGPLNIQFMGEDFKLLEVNPRFGGGCTASLAAAWKANRWLLQEYVLRVPADQTNFQLREIEVKRAWKDYVWG